jgi:hypothetical protein
LRSEGVDQGPPARRSHLCPIRWRQRVSDERLNTAARAGGGNYAFYEFADVEEARELSDSDKIKPLIADLDRVWGNPVSRRRVILEVVREIVSSLADRGADSSRWS